LASSSYEKISGESRRRAGLRIRSKLARGTAISGFEDRPVYAAADRAVLTDQVLGQVAVHT